MSPAENPRAACQLGPAGDPQVAAGRSGLYALLARLWLYEVDADLLDFLRDDPVTAAFSQAGGKLPSGRDALEDLAVEYCQLFVGPQEHLPPVQSVWSHGQFQSPVVESVQRFVDLLRGDPLNLPPGVMLDHLGAELLIMSRLQAALADPELVAGDRQRLNELAAEFGCLHLAWPGRLLDAAAAKARSDFYRSMIRLTRDFLAGETNDDAFR